MNKYEKRYLKIVNELVKKSFPELKRKKIYIKEKLNLKSTANITPILFNKFRIRTHQRARNYNKTLLIGIFVHELSHLCFYKGFNFYSKLKRFIKLFFSRKYRETETDKLAIRRGYAHQLYSQRKLRFKSKDKYSLRNKKIYLSPEEIKSYAESEGKW